MALTSQIDAAARTQRAPVGGSNLSQESPLLSMPARRESEERKERRQAARNLIRHAIDDSDRDLLLDAFALTYEEAAPLPVPGWPAVPPAAPVVRTKRCTRCDDVKDLEEFPLRYTVGARRTSHCRPCRAEQNKASRARRKEEGR